VLRVWSSEGSSVDSLPSGRSLPSLPVADVPSKPRYFETESVRRQRGVANSGRPGSRLAGARIPEVLAVRWPYMVAYGGAELTAYFGVRVSVYTGLASARS